MNVKYHSSYTDFLGIKEKVLKFKNINDWNDLLKILIKSRVG